MLEKKRIQNQGQILKAVLSICFFLLIISKLYNNSVTRTTTTNGGTTITYKQSDQRKGYNYELSSRIDALLLDNTNNNKIIGDKLQSIKTGSETIESIQEGRLHDSNSKNAQQASPNTITIEEILEFFTSFLHELHKTLKDHKSVSNFVRIWDIYHDLVMETLHPWDQKYLALFQKQYIQNSSSEDSTTKSSSMLQRRNDGSIFLSIVSYRDENCVSTISNVFEKAKYPDKIFVGLVQQNCLEDCFTGVLVGGKIEPIEPDEDCHFLFCQTHEELCNNGHMRVLHVNETESLGPYTARYFASRLYYGEEWFVQLDSHMTFAQDWDSHVIDMLHHAPSNKPVITHYPPDHTYDFVEKADKPGSRLCGALISDSDIDDEIILFMYTAYDKGRRTDIPKFAPFIAAGFFATTPEFLIDVPFDIFLPWTFTGEEIIMSARFFTHGYDIFSPTRNIIGHIYERRHTPKFWEIFGRMFDTNQNLYNPLSRRIMHRIKYQLKYPESSKDMIVPSTILSKVEDYTLGTNRTLEAYVDMAGIDLTYKFTRNPEWCFDGIPPPNVPEYKQYNHLYHTKKN